MPTTKPVEETNPYLTIRGEDVSEETNPYLTIRGGDVSEEADPYLTIGTTQTARREPPELRAATPMTPEDLALGEARRDVRKKGEEAAYEESTRKNLRNQGFPEPMISALLMPGGESLDRAISLAAPIAGGVAGTAAIPIAGPTAPYIGGGGAAALANTWAQLREHARSGATTPIDFKKGRFLGEVFMGAVIPAPARTLAPGMRAAQVIETGATLGGQMGAIGAGESALRQLGDEGTIDFRELAKDTTRGALTGAALGTTFSTASQIYKNAKLKNAKGIEGYSPSEIGAQIALRGGGGVGGFAYGWSSNPELPFDKRLENALLWASASGGLAPTAIFKAIKKVRGSGPAKTKVFADWQDAMNREYGPGTVPEVSDKLAYPEWKAAMTQRHGDNPYLDEVWDIIQLRKSEAEARTPAGKAKLAEEAAIAKRAEEEALARTAQQAKLAEEALAAEKAAAAEALAARQARAEEALAAQQAAGTETPGVPRRPIIDESEADLARRKINEDFGNNAGESAAVFEAAARAADEQAAARAADELAAARAAEELAATTARNLEPAANIARTIEAGTPVKSAEESAEVMGAAEARESARLAREAALDAGGFTAAKERARIEAQRNEELTPRSQLGFQSAAAAAAALDEANADPDEDEMIRNLRRIALGAVVPSLASKAPTFYSRLTRTVEQFPQSRASGAQWKGTIRNSKLGVNQDEFALAKVDDLQGDKIYPKAEVLEYLRANEVVVKDVTLGEGLNFTLKLNEGETAYAGRDMVDVVDPRNGLTRFTGTPSEAQNWVSESKMRGNGGDGGAPTYFSDYQLPGAKEGSYREVLLTVPGQKSTVPVAWELVRPNGEVVTSYISKDRADAAAAKGDYRVQPNYGEGRQSAWRDGHSQYSQHANPIVRLRYNERTTADGKRMLFLEEVQAPQKAEFEKMPALFQKNWREIAFKWAMRKASDEGFDSVGWTTGEQQAARYDLSKQVDAVRVTKNPDGTYGVEVRPPGNRGFRVVEAKTNADQLGNFIGKDLAEKSIADTSGEKFIATYDGLDLKVGGGGLKKLYDSDFRNVVNNLPVVKKSGQKVGTERISQEHDASSNTEKDWSEPSVRRILESGGEVYYTSGSRGESLLKSLDDLNELKAQVASGEIGEPRGYILGDKQPATTVHALTITPAIRESAMQGQPMFSVAAGAAAVLDEANADPDESDTRRNLRRMALGMAMGSAGIRRSKPISARLYAEVNYSSGAALRNTLPSFGKLPYNTQQAITKEVLEQIVPRAVDKIGGSLRVRSISMGDGIFGGEPAPSVAVELLGSARAIDLFAISLAHVSEQAATMSATFGLGGKNSRSVRFKKGDGSTFSSAEITSLVDDAKLGGFSVHQLPGGTEALITDATSNFTPKAFTEKKARQLFDQLTTWADVRNVALDIDIPTTRITAHANNWSSHPKGQTYLEILNRRGIGSKVPDLDGLRGEYRTLLEQSFDRYAPGVRQGRGGVLSSPPRVDARTGEKISSRQPNEAVRKIADDYNAQSGQTPIEHGHYVAVNESLAQRIAKAYDALPEVSRSPETIKAYEALAKEVGDQWDFAVKNLGIKFEPWTKEGQPYANSREMVRDVRDNNHIYFFQGGDPHPFLNAVDPKTGFTANDKLRAVHDLYGHAAEDYQFGPRGEENAWIKHSQMFSPEAQRALSSETRGQNSWVNFGAQNYENGVNKNIPAKDRPFAAQKTALLPEELTDWRSALGKSEPVVFEPTQVKSATGNTGGKMQFGSVAGFGQREVLARIALHGGGGAGGFAAGWSANSELPPDERLKKALMWAAAAGGLGPAALFKAVKLAQGSGPAKIPRAKLDPKTASLDDLRNIFIHEAEQSPSLLARINRATEVLQDRNQPLTEVEEAVLGSRPQGLTLGDRASLIAGAAGKAEAALTPLIELRKNISSEVDDLDVSTFLFLRRTMDRLETNKRNAATYAAQQANYVFGPKPVAPTPRDVGTFTEAIVRQKMGLLQAKLGNNNLLALDALGAEFQKLSDSNLQTLVDAGRLSNADRATIKADNDFYAPFKVMKYMSALEGIKGTGRAIDTSVSVIKAIKGIKDEDIQLGDIMLAMGENTLRTHVLAEKNRVMLALAALADADPTGKYIQRVAPHKSPPSGFVGVNYMKDGKKLELAVLEPVARAVKGLNEQQLGVVGQALKNSAAVFRLGTVGANIGFQLVNSVKDQKRFAELSKYGFTSMADLYRYPMDFAQAAISSWRSNILGKKDQLALDFMKSGSAGSTIAETLAPSAFRPQASVFNPLSYGIEWSARIGKGIEETTKIMGYKRGARLEGLEKLTGADRQKALDRIAYEVRNYAGSPDFNKHGTIGLQMNILFMFANARMQGVAADMRRLSGRTGGREAVSAMSRLAVGTGLPTLALWYYNQQGDNLTDYESLSKREKTNNWMIPQYGADGKPLYFINEDGYRKREYIKLPKTDILAQTALITEGMLNFAKDQDPKAAMEAGQQFLENLSPINISGRNYQERVESIVSGLNPILKTPLEFSTGRDTFRHQPIVPRRLEGAPANLQFRDSTNEIFKDVANRMSPDASPLQLQRAVENMTGGLATQFMRPEQPGRSLLVSSPFFGRFFGSPAESKEKEWEIVNQWSTKATGESVVRDNAIRAIVNNMGKQPEAKTGRDLFTLIERDPKSIPSIISALKDKSAGTTAIDKALKSLPSKDRAGAMVDMLGTFKTSEEKSEYLESMVRRGVITKDVMVEMRNLMKKP